MEGTLTGWRRDAAPILVLAVVVFAVTAMYGSFANQVYESHIGALPDKWGGTVCCSDSGVLPSARGIRTLAIIVPYSFLTLPASWIVTGLDVRSDVETGSVAWVLLQGANAAI